MPPLCTAGFGIASGNLYYFFGAFYLYFINSVFISLATYLVVRILKYPKKVFLDKQREKKVSRYVGILAFLTIAPSLFLSYNLVRTSYFNEKAKEFITEELNFPNTQILSKTITNTKDKKEIKVVLIGDEVSDDMITNAREKLDKFGLRNVNLIVQQGFGQGPIDINNLKSMLMQDLYKNNEEILKEQSIQIDSLKRTLDKYDEYKNLATSLMPELKVLFPYVEEVSCSNTYLVNKESGNVDNVFLVYLKCKGNISQSEKDKIKSWLEARIETNNIKLIID
jgi:hypothetical protein